MNINTKELLNKRIKKLELENKALKEEINPDIETPDSDSISNTKDFLNVLSYKIITPLNSIIGMSNFLNDTTLDQQQKRMVSGIRNSSLSIVNIYNEILNFAEIEDSKKSKVEKEFNIKTVLDDAIDSFYRNIFRKKNIKITNRFDSNIPQNFISDPETIKQIILLSLGEPENNDLTKVINIGISVEDIYKKPNLIISITHKSLIINDQHLKHFSRNIICAKETINAGNNFFKFLFAKKITEIHDGSFTIRKSESDTTLIISMPVKMSIKQEKQLISPVIPEFRGIKALIASENIGHRQIIKNNLQGWGIKNVSAKTEKELLEKLISTRDINFAIISDKISTIDVKTLAKKISSLPGKSNFPLILLESQRHLLMPSDIFIDRLKTAGDQTIIFDILLKNIDNGKIQSDNSHLLDEKLALKVPLKILIVEDDNINMDLMLLLLKKLGYTADTAFDGFEAIKKAKENQYDIIFMDIQIPRLNGYDASNKILSNPSNTKTKIIAISANHLPDIRKSAIESGMVDFINKPISFLKIEETIIKWGFLNK
ncbi:MAG: response regulator [Bacteroidota bacterium]|nr:response regulator [Bacteroidota bacterium]